ncbi:MAG: hypothetical protein WB763_00760 [Terriglobia bacterium]|jgi:hypothetical protein
MNKSQPFVALIGAVVLSGSLAGLHGQAPSPSIEQQLRKQYALTRVGGNGVVVQAGTVLIVQADGIKANPASYSLFWPNNYKKDAGRVKQPMMTAKSGISKVNREELRFLQVGEKVYLAQMDIKDANVVFGLQSCGGANQNDIPYRAEVSFQLGKGYLNASTFKDIQETIGQVFAIDTAMASQGPEQTPGPSTRPAPVAAPPAVLRLPATYANPQAPADQLQLNADNSFSLQEAGQAYHGTFAVNGNTLELTISESNTKTTATLQGNNLTDSSGQTWVLREQSAGTPPGGTVLQNEDVIKMAKAGFDDAIIIAKITSSKCQFDTSTDALIRLKQSGVTAAVLKAMVEAGK